MDSTNVVAGTNATASHYNNLRNDLVLGKTKLGVETDGATITFDLSDITKGKFRQATLQGNRTLAISNPPAADSQGFAIILLQDGTGSRTVTWWAGIKWVNATAPTLTTTANRYDIFAFLYDGTNYYGSIVGQNYG